MKDSIIKQYKLSLVKIMQYSKTSDLGLTDLELRKYFGDLIMENFGNWIDGQTCAVTEDRQLVVYPEDILRFASSIRFPGPDMWD